MRLSSGILLGQPAEVARVARLWDGLCFESVPTRWARLAGSWHRTVGVLKRDTTTSRARDAELVSATIAGDRKAFGELVSLYQRRVFALAYRFVNNPDDASDLTQRAFLKAFQSLDKLKKRDAFSSWLFRIVANLSKNQIRFGATKQFQDVEDTPLAADVDIEQAAVRRAQCVALREALADLPPKQRECVTLRIDADLSFREIGNTVGCSEASARVNFHHGMRALRKRLAPKDE